MALLTDAEVFGSTAARHGLLSDADVFGSEPPPEPSFFGRVRNFLTPNEQTVIPPEPALPRPPGAGVMYDAASPIEQSRARLLQPPLTPTIGPVPGQEPTFGNIARDLMAALPQTGRAVREGVRSSFGDATGFKEMQRDSIRRFGQNELDTTLSTPRFESDLAQDIYGGAKSAIQTAPAIAAMFVNPAAGLMAMGGQVGLPARAKYRERGATPGEATLGGVLEGGAEALFEAAPMGFLVKKFGKVGMGKFIAGLLAREIPTEIATAIAQQAVDTAIANPDKTWDQYMAELPADIRSTIVATITQTGLMGGASSITRALRQNAPERPTSDLPTAPLQARGPSADRAVAVPGIEPAPSSDLMASLRAAFPDITQAASEAAGSHKPGLGGSTPPPATQPLTQALGAIDAKALPPDQAVLSARRPVEPNRPTLGRTDVQRAAPATADQAPPAVATLQNRDRASAALIAQMNDIAARPDPSRLSFSREFASGAPVVAVNADALEIPPDQFGLIDTITDAAGKQYPIQYAVIDAREMIASNRADGSRIEQYADAATPGLIRAIAGNGRLAGLQAAYQRDTATKYISGIAGDTSLHGVDVDVIGAMEQPVLVRVMRQADITPDMGDISNQSGVASLSAVEQAQTDAARVDLATLDFGDNGLPSAAAVRAFVQQMPPAEQSGLMAATGQPARQAVERLIAATFAKAYGSPELVQLQAQAIEPEARNVIAALVQAAPAMAQLEGAGSLDIRPLVVEAAQVAVNAARRGVSLSKLAAQRDMAVAPDAYRVIRLLAALSRSPRQIAERLRAAANFAYSEASKTDTDMFGTVEHATRDDVLRRLEDESSGAQTVEQPSGTYAVERDAERQADQSDAARDTGGPESGRTDEFPIHRPDFTGGRPDTTSATRRDPIGFRTPLALRYEREETHSYLTAYRRAIRAGAKDEDAHQLAKDAAEATRAQQRTVGAPPDTDLTSSKFFRPKPEPALLTNPTPAELAQRERDKADAARRERASPPEDFALTSQDEKTNLEAAGQGRLFEPAAAYGADVSGRKRLPDAGADSAGRQRERGDDRPSAERDGDTDTGGRLLPAGEETKPVDAGRPLANSRFARKQRGLVMVPPAGTIIDPVTHRLKPGEKVYGALEKFVGQMILAKVGLASNAPPAFRRLLAQYRSDKHKAAEKARDVVEAGASLPLPERELISDYIEQELKAGVVPPAHIVEVAGTMDAAIAAQTKELLELGMLSPEAAAKWQGRYLPRYYAKHLGDKGVLARLFRIGIRGNHIKARGLFEIVDKSDLVGWEAQGFQQRPDIPTGEDNKIVIWRDWTRGEREKMGEMRDAVYRFARGMLETGSDIAAARLFERTARSEFATASREVAAQKGWKQVPDIEIEGTSLKRYGKLSGKYVDPEIWKELEYEFKERGAWERSLAQLTALWKEGKTALNPATHSANVVSSIVMADFAGISPLRIDKYVAALKDFRNDGPATKAALDIGLLGGEAIVELQQWLPDPKDVLAARSATGIAALFNTRAATLLGKITGATAYRQGMRKLYGAEDAFFKVLIFKHYTERGMTPQQAADEANRYIFDYRDLPPLVKRIRDSAIGLPFISYTYKAIPAVAHSILTRPWVVAKYAALFNGINALAFAIGGDDDEGGERKFMPEYMQNWTPLFFPTHVRVMNDDAGNPQYLNAARLTPLGTILQPVNGEGVPMLQSFAPNNPIYQTIMTLGFNRDALTGREFYKDSDSTQDKVRKAARFLYQQLMPSTPLLPGSAAWEKVTNGVAQAIERPIDVPLIGASYTGKVQGRSGREETLPKALANTVAGVNLRGFDPAARRRSKLFELEREEREIKSDMRRHRTNQGISDEAKEARIEAERAKLRTLADKRQELLR